MTLVLAGLFMPASVVGPVGWTLALLGLAASAAAAFGKVMLERSAVRRLEAIKNNLPCFAHRCSRPKTIATRWMPSCPPARPVPSIVGCKRRKRTWPPWKSLRRWRCAAARRGRRQRCVRRRSDEARQSLKTAQRRLREAVLAAGLPQRITSKQVQQLFARGDRLAEMEHPAAERREELVQRRRELEAISTRIVQLAAEVGLEDKESGVRGQGSEAHPISILQSLSEAVQRQEAAIARVMKFTVECGEFARPSPNIKRRSVG